MSKEDFVLAHRFTIEAHDQIFIRKLPNCPKRLSAMDDLNGLGPEVCFSLLMAANFLDHNLLLRAMSHLIYMRFIRGNSPEEIRNVLGLDDDLTEREIEEKIREISEPTQREFK